MVGTCQFGYNIPKLKSSFSSLILSPVEFGHCMVLSEARKPVTIAQCRGSSLRLRKALAKELWRRYGEGGQSQRSS